MFQFNYYRANSTQQACDFLAQHGEECRIIAGGTDLMVQIREKDEKWAKIKWVLDISHLQDKMNYIKEEEKVVHIGALATHTEIEASAIIKEYFPFLSVACGTVGSPQIRNLGTIGGSICNASPAADPLSPLIAVDATVAIQGVEGKREVLLKDFYLGKSAVDLKKGELLLGFTLPKLSKDAITHFEKLGRRKALAISRLNVAVAMICNDQQEIEFVRIAPGCVFTKPMRVLEAEALLLGKKATRELFEEAGKAVSAEMIRITGYRWSTEYKQPTIEGLVERALLRAAGMELE